jgi:CHAT domain-containing protein
MFICPTGPFTQVPLHAAGTKTRHWAEQCSDYFVASYTPTVGALLNALNSTCRLSHEKTKVLVAAVPKPFSGRPLPFSFEEALAIVATVPKANLVDQSYLRTLESREDVSASIDYVLSKLPEASIVHMACHGLQDPNSPLDSGFMMSDGLLTVAQLMALNMPSAFLAFLSACDTARGDETQPDQAIHLAAAMLFAGFRSVVATMW